MKKIIGIFLLLGLIQVSIYAQRDIEERVESMRVAHITNALEMSPDQAQKFWPVYNELKTELKAIKKANRPIRHPKEMTETEADQLIAQHFESEAKQLELKQTYFQKMRQFLSAQQLVKLHFAEKEFKRQLLRQVREQRRRQ